jgi:hypothetical protein
VLEPYAGKSAHENHGQRVVAGQRLMQSAGDIFLSWIRGLNGRNYYLHQLRDMKMSAIIEDRDFDVFANMWAFVRAHAGRTTPP